MALLLLTPTVFGVELSSFRAAASKESSKRAGASRWHSRIRSPKQQGWQDQKPRSARLCPCPASAASRRFGLDEHLHFPTPKEGGQTPTALPFSTLTRRCCKASCPEVGQQHTQSAELTTCSLRGELPQDKLSLLFCVMHAKVAALNPASYRSPALLHTRSNLRCS